ncbi:MAG: 16S rRNA (cytosine(967)-C(5))-methyltransferase RsmB [Clostridia bacterium]
MNNAFLASYNCLDQIFRQQAYSEIALNNTLISCNVRDKSLVTKIVYGVLDNNLHLEYIISGFAKSIKPVIKIILKIGVYCLKFLSIPVYAVINDCAELTKTTGKTQLVGFVNATLRNIYDALTADKIFYPKDKTTYLSIYYSFPLFATKLLIEQYGVSDTIKILSHKFDHNTHIRINLEKISLNDFLEYVKDKKSATFESPLDDCLFVKGGLIGIDPTYYTAMSLGSCLVTRCISCVGQARVLDLCSAPGGKAVYLAQLNKSARIVACDIYPHRLSLIASYAKRMGVENRLNIVESDATEFNPNFASNYDYVLCDAPCSGFGVFYGKPDIKLFRTEQNLQELIAIQGKILANASKYVKVGGILVYSTCSLLKQENQDIVDAFLANHSNFALSPFSLDGYVINQACKQFLPYEDNVEGYYVARLVRKS